MFLEIKLRPETKLVGKSLKASLAEDQSFALWSSFMPERKLVQNTISSDFYSVQVYDPKLSFNDFNEHTIFEKWAAVAVSDYQNLPETMTTLNIPKGLYAVFLHKGTAADFPKTSAYIFREWLPSSVYELDNRPHFEILGAKYKNNHPDSEEEVWIPIREK